MTNDERDQHLIESVAILKDLKKAVFGNGKPGLLDRVIVIEERQASCPAREAFKMGARQQRSANIISFGALAVAVIAFFKTIGLMK